MNRLVHGASNTSQPNRLTRRRELKESLACESFVFYGSYHRPEPGHFSLKPSHSFSQNAMPYIRFPSLDTGAARPIDVSGRDRCARDIVTQREGGAVCNQDQAETHSHADGFEIGPLLSHAAVASPGILIQRDILQREREEPAIFLLRNLQIFVGQCCFSVNTTGISAYEI